MIIRSKSPKVLEFPFAELKTYLTPTDEFYVRNHFPEPTIDPTTWRLKVEGCVEKSLDLSYDQLRRMPSHKVVAMLECAGNNRLFLHPSVKGVQWELGGASNAEWTGVSLSTVLSLAGVKPEAMEVVFEGADSGEVDEPPKPLGNIHFARSLPMKKARQRDVLLCYAMNGEPLSQSHGFPIRALVPGWYAMSSVKWLSRVTVIDHAFGGYFQTTDYAYWEDQNGHKVRVPITQMLVKSEISHPQLSEVVPAASKYQILGAGWVGDSTLSRIEISTDGGATWALAKIVGTIAPNAWCFFEYCWDTPTEPGPYTIVSRATDENGVTQPVCHDPDRATYMINFCLPITVEVR